MDSKFEKSSGGTFYLCFLFMWDRHGKGKLKMMVTSRRRAGRVNGKSDFKYM